MSAARGRAGDHEGATDEARWRARTWWDLLPPPTMPRPGARVVVVAAHPDDEVLAVGGLLHGLARRGTRVHVVSVTDGEAAYGPPALPRARRAWLARTRRVELDHALAGLGLGGCTRTHLGLRDSGLTDVERDLRAALAPLVHAADVVLSPLPDDGHPDHDACGRAARDLAAASGTTWWAYPVWAWHWRDPDHEGPRSGPGALDWEPARLLRLGHRARAAKGGAMRCFASQVAPTTIGIDAAPVLPETVLAHFRRPYEVVWQHGVG